MCNITTLGLIKMSRSHIPRSCLGYSIFERIVNPIFIIFILGETFLTVNLLTQTKIAFKHFSLGKLTYQLTTSRFKKMLVFHLQGSCLGNTYNQRDGVGPSNYCSPRWDISNSLLTNPNGDSIQKLQPQETDVPTYHFYVNKTIGVWFSRFMVT